MKCKKCGSSECYPHKKGFSGKEAVSGFVISAFVISLVWGMVILYEHEKVQQATDGAGAMAVPLYEYHPLLVWLSGLICLVSMMAGTVDMNKIKITCLNCGHEESAGTGEKNEKKGDL